MQYENDIDFETFAMKFCAVWAAPSLCNSGQVTNITLSCSDDLKMLQCCRDGRDGLHGRDGSIRSYWCTWNRRTKRRAW